MASGGERMKAGEPIIVAHVRDLLFSSRIGETARRLGYRFRAARSLDDLRAALESRPALVMIDLTSADLDPDAALREINAAGLYDTLHNRMFLDPVLLGTMPERIDELVTDTDYVHDGDLDTIAVPIDVLGINYYNPTRIGAPPADADMPFDIQTIDEYETTHFGWPVVPEGLTEVLVGLKDTYGERLPPIRITENGCSQDDEFVDGVVDDPRRISYLEGHLGALLAAIDAGVDIDGYYCWSLMDNFEWAEGFGQRFGLIHVDFDTLARTPKSSYYWFQQLLKP